jgi:hypothetical protein
MNYVVERSTVPQLHVYAGHMDSNLRGFHLILRILMKAITIPVKGKIHCIWIIQWIDCLSSCCDECYYQHL